MGACGGSDFDGPDPDSGIPLALAEERSARLSNVRYDLKFTIPESATDPITGTAAIRFDLKDTERPVVLDFAPGADHLTSVTVGGRAATYRAVNGHIVIAPRALAAGENAVQIDFRAGDDRAQPQPRLPVHALRAGTRAPDVPVLRPAGPQGAIHAGADGPAGWEAVSNGVETAREIAGGQSTAALRRDAADSDLPLRVRGRQVPGRDGHERNGRTFRMFHRETDAGEGRAQPRRDLRPPRVGARSGSRTTPPSRIRSASSTSSLIPSFQFGGMEHPGAVFYNASVCCSTSRRPRTSCSAAPASSRTRRRTCGSAIW